MIGYIAKAITAFIVTLLVAWLGDIDVVHELATPLEAILTAALTALAVYAVPNWASGPVRRVP